MNENTPIKRHPALVAFSRDHHFGLLLNWKIKHGIANGVEAERISNYVLYFFEEDLQKHFEEEERELFPKLPADNELRQRAESEHRVIHEMIHKLRMDKSNKEFLLQFGEMLNSHIRFEERELFGFMQQTLSDAELASITSHGDRSCENVDARWQDIFWMPGKS